MSRKNRSTRTSGRAARTAHAPGTARARITAAERRRPQSWGMGFLAALVLGVAVIALGFLGGRAAATSFAYAAGMSGRPGMLTVDRCWGDNPAKPRLITSCAGEFRSDDGRTVTEGSPIGSSHRLGAALPVEYGDGGYHATGLSYATGDLAGLLAVVPVGVLGLWLVCLAFGVTPAGARLRAELSPDHNRAVRYVLWGSVGCLLAAGGCLLVGVAGRGATP
ncbi:hypothetical protein [Streptomyces sp. CBMA123]|uniref:hypothetical protein n=1 Tax=Streptomyces sp. CBMA123 TaxID=1896313 RepID=UPI0016621B1D|nr:hypothetical protein [Streptomyces sp. CBMA123]MBD0696030.1 hypothetical protein [Streptomyces sp. CBMA123]